MAKKKAGRRSRPETTPLIVRIDTEIREGVRRYCYENRISYSAFIRGLLIEKLRAGSYLGGKAA